MQLLEFQLDSWWLRIRCWNKCYMSVAQECILSLLFSMTSPWEHHGYVPVLTDWLTATYCDCVADYWLKWPDTYHKSPVHMFARSLTCGHVCYHLNQNVSLADFQSNYFVFIYSLITNCFSQEQTMSSFVQFDKTPVEIAVSNGRNDIVEILQMSGVSLLPSLP